MYSKRHGLVIGFHGCRKEVADGLLSGELAFKPSQNDYDWLGSGMYFWEHDPKRAELFIAQKKRWEKADYETAVVGATIDLGLCLDLIRVGDLELVKAAYELMKDELSKGLMPLKKNKQSSSSDIDFRLRELDCSVFQYLHKIRDSASDPAFDSVRGMFWEGPELYPNAGFRSRNHVQICIRNPNCVLGFFKPRDYDLEYPMP